MLAQRPYIDAELKMQSDLFRETKSQTDADRVFETMKDGNWRTISQIIGASKVFNQNRLTEILRSELPRGYDLTIDYEKFGIKAIKIQKTGFTCR